ncbi:serine/threonine-protein kinase pim-2-like [Danio aesculapii]|uniref:serine/threonine-protein kinase pim-2-like n=1 Tax=Danio aesculapii TaxID=1142201 RepID=UPI0024BF3D56|nr:serine/threonine-protein kinase pim-2-like [Danio aesculapii]
MLFTVLGVIALFLRERNIKSTVSGQDERFDRQGGLVMVPPNSDGREIGDWCEDSSLHLEEQINVQSEEPSLEEPVDGQSEEQSLVEPDSVHGEELSLVEPDSVHGEEQSLVEPDSVHGEEQSLVEPDKPDSVHGEEQSLVEPDSVHGEELSLVEPVDGHSEDSASTFSRDDVPPKFFYAESSSSDDFPQEFYSAGTNCNSELTASSYSSFFSAESGCGEDLSTDFLSAESGCGEDLSTNFESAESGCGDDPSTNFESAESGCGDDPSTNFESAESGCGDDPSPNVVSTESGCGDDPSPNVVSTESGCGDDPSPNVVSTESGCGDDPPPNMVSAEPGCSHYNPPNVVSAKPGCKDDVAQGATCQTEDAVPSQPEKLKDKDTHIIEINSQRYEIGAELGKGGFGTVFAGTRLEDGLQVAVKIVNCKVMRLIRVGGFEKPVPAEIALHFLATKGPKIKQIVELLDWKVEPQRYIIVVERPIPCVTLREFLNDNKEDIAEDVLRKIMFHVTIAAHTCCQRGVFHRDIKPDNLLINPETFEVKLIDFGCSAILTKDCYQQFSGTRLFAPPEFVNTGRYHGEPSTVWSLGIVQFLLMFKNFPTVTDLLQLNSRDLEIPRRSKECSDFIRACLQLNTDFRYKLHTLRAHAWFKVMNTF